MQILIWQQIPQLKDIKLFSNLKFKIRIFQLINKILLKQRSLNQIRHCLTGHNQTWHHIFFIKTLKYFNDFQNQNFSILWLKWTQTIGMKQNQIFFLWTYTNLTSFFIGHKILKYFNDFCNWNFHFQFRCKRGYKQVNWN